MKTTAWRLAALALVLASAAARAQNKVTPLKSGAQSKDDLSKPAKWGD